MRAWVWETTGAGEGSWQEQEEEKEGTKEKTPATTAGAATGAATPVARKAPMSGTKGLASPDKKRSPTKLASKRRGCLMPRYEVPMQQDFSDKELAHLLAPRCVAMKRPCTLDGAKTHERSNAPDPMVEKTYHQVVLVRRVQAVVEKAREAEARGEAISLSKNSLVLPTHQGDEERGSGKRKRKASLPLLPMNKGKKRVRVVSLVAVTPKVESEGDEEDEMHRLGMTIETSKAALEVEDLADPSHQAEALQDVGAQQEEMEQEEEEAEIRLEAALQVQPWGWELPQWSWLPEWGANDPMTRDISVRFC
ncbi:hypothetical protein C0993_008494 [Termitomyces sp. T159_Od127]|nr:hypothetical protein C0993_008494 [Termitomyces sp. T159_Od127]